MKHILILYSTIDGHTREIGQRLATRLAEHGHRAELCALGADGATPSRPLAEWDVLVLGASIRYGHFRRAVYDFVGQQQALLERRPSAFFGVNAVARKPLKATPQTNPYVRKFFARVSWRPQAAAVFGGKVDYPRYNLAERNIIRFIMWMTKGPTDPRSCTDFTDWARVDAFAQEIAAL